MPKSRKLSDAFAVAAPPVPLRVTLCGLSAALSAIVNVPLIVPVTEGAKLTLIVQLAPPANEGGQLSVSENCWLAVMLATESAGPPRFVKVSGCGALLVPTACNGYWRYDPETDAVGLGERAVPFNETTRLAPFVPFTVRLPIRGPGAGPPAGEPVAEGMKETL